MAGAMKDTGHKSIRGLFTAISKKVHLRKKASKEQILNEKLSGEDISLNVSYFNLYRFASSTQKLIVLAGLVASLANGLPMPFMLLSYGRTIDSFVVTQFCQVLNMTNISEICPDNVDDTNINELYPLCNWTGLNITIPDLTQSVGRRAIDFVAIGIAAWILSWLQTTLLSNAAERIIRNVRYELFKSVLYKPVSWFDFNTSGSVSTLLSDTTEKFKNGIGDKVGMLAQASLLIVASIVVSLLSGWKLSLVMLASSPIIVVVIAYLTKAMVKGTGKETKAYREAGSIAQETFSNIRTVHAFNGTKSMQDRYDVHLSNAYAQSVKKGMFTSFATGAMFLLIFCTYSLGFWYGGKLVNSDELSVGVIMIVFFGIQNVVFTVGGNVPHYSAVTESKSAAFSVYSAIDDHNEQDSKGAGEIKLADTDGFIEFAGVTFSYPSRRELPALNDVSFKVPKGHTIAIVGESGSGKSTIIQLLLRFYSPNKGKVLIGGQSIAEMPVNQLRKMIGLVSQEPVLFSMTIGENIRLGKPDATDEEVREACRIANALGFIEAFPDKFDTMVGEDGSQLSGGQKQRIAIARALVANPLILLLDEATSALDGESERLVQDALDAARRGRTTLIVAHRLSTIRNVDIIIGMCNGRVVESGSHEELMKINGVYRNLVEAQQKEELEKHDEKSESVVKKRRATSVASLRSALSSEDEQSEDKQMTKKVMAYVMKMNAPEINFIVIGSLLLVIWGVLQVVFQIFFAKVIVAFSQCNAQKRTDIINQQSMRFLLIGIACFFTQFGGFGCLTISGERLTRRIRATLFKALTRQEIGFFDKKENAVGSVCTMLSTEASSVQGATGIRIGTALSGISILLVGLIVAFVYGWQLALVILAFVPVLIGAGLISMQVIAGFNSKDKKYLERAGRIVIESTLNIRTVKQLCSEQYFLSKYEGLIDELCSRNLKKTIITGALFGFSNGIVFFAVAACYYAGAIFIERGYFGTEKMMLVFGSLLFGAMSVGQSQAMAPDFGKAVSAARRIYEVVHRVPEIDAECSDGEIPKHYNGNYRFENVKFSYPERKGLKVLKGISLSFSSDIKTALVGFSGCGKSTIIQLLERFYDPTSGTIYLDDKDVRSLNLGWYRQQMGIVSQEPILFNWSIKENIAFGDNTKTLTMEEIRKAAKLANIDDFIVQLPEGYETVVGSKGSLLSGGQKQRICIARAIVRNPKLLLMDEATSALDNESEKQVQEALYVVQKDRGSVSIAHRMTTIEKCDKIYLLDNGRVVEEGNHQKLMQERGRYYELYLHSQR